MNARTLSHVVATLAITGLLAACGTGKTPDTATNSAPLLAGKPVSSAASEASPPAEAEAAPTPIPDTADAIWKAIDQQSADLKATITSGDLKQVHHKAFAIRDLVAALPTHASGLAADAQTKLQSDVKFVATLADRLDAAGDGNDKAGAQENYDKLVGVLRGIPRAK
jgi:hypothetical protein